MEPEPINNQKKVVIENQKLSSPYIFSVENVVCSFDVKSNLKLQHIAKVAKNVEYRKKDQRQSYISPVP